MRNAHIYWRGFILERNSMNTSLTKMLFVAMMAGLLAILLGDFFRGVGPVLRISLIVFVILAFFAYDILEDGDKRSRCWNWCKHHKNTLIKKLIDLLKYML